MMRSKMLNNLRRKTIRRNLSQKMTRTAKTIRRNPSQKMTRK